MTNDKQIEAVARAIYLDQYASLGGIWEAVETREHWYSLAKAAIDASGAEHIPMLVEALKKCQTTANYILTNFMDIDGLPVGHIGAIEDTAEEALNKLPEELRG